MQCVIDIDADLGERLGAAFRDAPPEDAERRLRALLELALTRTEEAALLGLLEGRTCASLEVLGERLAYLEALLDRVLFFAVASYALARAGGDGEDARRIFRTSYEDARRDAERRSLRSAGSGTAARC